MMIRRKIVTLTDAQIKALPTTPVTILPAPGAGLLNRILAISLVIKSGSGAYTNINAVATLHLQTPTANLTTFIANDSALTTDLTRLSDFLGGTNEKYAMLLPYHDAIDAGSTSGSAGYIVPNLGPALADYVNVVARIEIDNSGSGNLTGGHAANTLRVVVYYVKEATA